MSSRIWILGAPDPEMEAIESLLTQVGETVAFALGDDGERVNPRNMYQARLAEPITANTVYEVECMVANRDQLIAPETVTIDHHRPGDFGYGKPPAEFMSASSIGQVLRLIGQKTIPLGLYLTAAADHCLGAAYRGECPGVDPDALMTWRAESRAKFQGRTPNQILADIDAAQKEIKQSKLIQIGDYQHCGPTGKCGCGPNSYGSGTDISGTYYGTGDCYCDCWGCNHIFPAGVIHDMRRETPIPELPEAAMRLDAAYVSGPLNGPDGRKKYTCSGRPEHIKWFLKWAPSQGLTDTYGDPARGFAGGYK